MQQISETSFWNRPVAELTVELDARPEGLSSQEAEHRLVLYGPNDVTADKRKPAWVRFLGRFRK